MLPASLFVAGIEKRKFFQHHPKVNQAVDNVKQAKKSSEQAERLIYIERDRMLGESNLLKMRQEELNQRYVARQMVLRSQTDREHCMFIQLCKRWWADDGTLKGPQVFRKFAFAAIRWCW